MRVKKRSLCLISVKEVYAVNVGVAVQSTIGGSIRQTKQELQNSSGGIASPPQAENLRVERALNTEKNSRKRKKPAPR